ncbi:hypothetical protein CL618_01510 [archaeon]|nr:hypothetical protein [archaeon]|tara:strand:+ start:98 stop:343 length:246 start_codon:yes stop_codon:yes gene_type:complete
MGEIDYTSLRNTLVAKVGERIELFGTHLEHAVKKGKIMATDNLIGLLLLADLVSHVDGEPHVYEPTEKGKQVYEQIYGSEE